MIRNLSNVFAPSTKSVHSVHKRPCGRILDENIEFQYNMTVYREYISLSHMLCAQRKVDSASIIEFILGWVKRRKYFTVHF